MKDSKIKKGISSAFIFENGNGSSTRLEFIWTYPKN